MYMVFTLIFCVLISIGAVWVATSKWIQKAPEVGVTGWDMNKPEKPEIPEMGGVPLLFGFIMAVLIYVGMNTFLLNYYNYTPIFAVLCTVLMAAIIGIMDDILGWKAGLRQWQKPLFMLFAALPMMAINEGQTSMVLPIIGNINWGFLFPLFIIPIGIVIASNAYNMVAGYNGLEAGMGIIIFSTMGFIALKNGKMDAVMLSFIMLGALISFLYYNWTPAKIFPGDTMTYAVGALAACVAIIGDMEKITVFLFFLYGVDFLMQARGRFKKEAFGKVNSDGTLTLPFSGIYHLTHLAISILNRYKGSVYEKDVVLFVCSLEAMMAIVGIVLY